MFTYFPKDPHYVLGYCIIYMIILSDHVLWYRFDTRMPSTYCIKVGILILMIMCYGTRLDSFLVHTVERLAY